MFWTGFAIGFVVIGFAVCLAIALTAHFVRERRQRSAFIASLSPAQAKPSEVLKRSTATGAPFATCCPSRGYVIE
jgi:hypothetical protein